MIKNSPVVNYTDKLLREVLAKYKESLTPVELEIRVKGVTKAIFEKVYAALLGRGDVATIESSVNIISSDVFETGTKNKVNPTQYIRKIVFDGVKAVRDEYIKKTAVLRPVQVDDFMKYSVSLATEVPSNKFNSASNSLVRFKLRTSFLAVAQQKWRFDLTAVAQETLSAERGLKQTRDNLFTAGMTPANLMDNLNHEIITNYEIELEYVGPQQDVSFEDFGIVNEAFGLVNAEYVIQADYQQELARLSTHLKAPPQGQTTATTEKRTLKQLLNQPWALTKNMYFEEVYPAEAYYVTVKLDGLRVVAVVEGGKCKVVDDKAVTCVAGSGTAVGAGVSIFDCEMVGEVLHVFDCIMYEGENIVAKPFVERLEYVKKAPKIVGPYVKCESKLFVKIEKDIKKAILEVHDVDYGCGVDGIILTEPNHSYEHTKNYKWKPYADNTIDFLCMRCPKSMLGVEPYRIVEGKSLYLLFVGIRHQVREQFGIGLLQQYKSIFSAAQGGNYYPIQYSSMMNPLAYLYYHAGADDLNGKVVELGRDDTNSAWIFKRLRADRQAGNDYKTAESTYVNFVDPFPLECLWEPSSRYFSKAADDIYLAANKFKRFVISIMLKSNLSDKLWVIDAAAGRGADLHRYQEIGVSNALFVDIDATAISELIRRRFAMFATKKKYINKWYGRGNELDLGKVIVKDSKNLTVHTLVADLKLPADELVALAYGYGAREGFIEGVVCNFALHYLCGSVEAIRNFLSFVGRMLSVGGVFMFAVMSGEKIFERLEGLEQGQTWESREREVLKYAIRKDYPGKKLASFGQIVSVLLPFSGEMYSEPLCNIGAVVAEAKKLGFSLEIDMSMTEYLQKFEAMDRALYARLTVGDFEYVDMHSFVSLRLIKKNK